MTRLARLLAALNRRHPGRIPPAPDNQPGTDPTTLWTCRRTWTASPDLDTWGRVRGVGEGQ